MESIITPSLRAGRSVISYSFDVLIAVAALTVFSYVQYGLRPVLVVLIAIASAVISETVCCLLCRRRITLGDGTAFVTGGLIGVLMSPIVPIYVPIIASVFAIVIAKMPFGGSGRNIFNPAAAGVALVTVCFERSMSAFPNPSQNVRLWWDTSDVLYQNSVAATLKSGGTSFETFTDLLFGSTPGAIGTTTVLVLVACLLYLRFRRTVSTAGFIAYMLTCTALALLFPRAEGDYWRSVMLELFSGTLLFTGVFFLNDPTTTPHHTGGRVAFGILLGGMVMLLRHFGQYADGACFAVLLLNPFAPIIDRWTWQLHRFVEMRWIRRE